LVIDVSPGATPALTFVTRAHPVRRGGTVNRFARFAPPGIEDARISGKHLPPSFHQRLNN
jgi:hypothetical protein